MSPFTGSAGPTREWRHFGYAEEAGVATVTFDRPERLNALTFEVYADLRDLLAELPNHDGVRVLVLTGRGRGFCSGGDVRDIIGALQAMGPGELLDFTRMTGAVVRGCGSCPCRWWRPSTGSRPGPGRSSPWPPTSACWPARPRWPSCSPGWGCRGRTWAARICCRGWSGWAGPPSCCCSATRSTPTGRPPSA